MEKILEKSGKFVRKSVKHERTHVYISFLVCRIADDRSIPNFRHKFKKSKDNKFHVYYIYVAQ